MLVSGGRLLRRNETYISREFMSMVWGLLFKGDEGFEFLGLCVRVQGPVTGFEDLGLTGFWIPVCGSKGLWTAVGGQLHKGAKRQRQHHSSKKRTFKYGGIKSRK